MVISFVRHMPIASGTNPYSWPVQSCRIRDIGPTESCLLEYTWDICCELEDNRDDCEEAVETDVNEDRLLFVYCVPVSTLSLLVILLVLFEW